MLNIFNDFDPDLVAGEVEFRKGYLCYNMQYLKWMSSILILFVRALYIPGMGCSGEK